MTDSIEAFLNSDVGKKAVEETAQTLFGWASGAEMQSDAMKICRETANIALRAFLSSLAESGAMREAYGYDGFLGEDNWQTYTSESHVRTRDFPAFILRRE